MSRYLQKIFTGEEEPIIKGRIGKNKSLCEYGFKCINITNPEADISDGVEKMKVQKIDTDLKEAIKPEHIKADKKGNRRIEKLTISDVREIQTVHGKKIVIDVEHENKERCVFLNAFSTNNLIEDISDDTEDWKGKKVSLEVVNNKNTFNKDAVIVIPL